MAVSDDTAELIQTARNNTLAVSPLVVLSARDVGAAAGALVDAVIRTPRVARRHLGNLGREVSAVLRGESTLAPDPKDRRFANPAALRKALDTGGANYKQGLRNLTADIRYNHGLQQRSGKEVDAPIQTGSVKHGPLCPAPGTYVLEK